jgi:hypothetical protein
MEEVTCELAPGRVAECFVALAMAATLAIAALLPFPDAARVAVCVWLAACAVHAGRKLRRTHKLRIAVDGSIELHEGTSVRAGRVAAGSFVCPWLTIVNWRPDGSRFTRTLVLLPDMVGSDALRNIRVILRWA